MKSAIAPWPSTRRDQRWLNSAMQAPMRVPPDQSSTASATRSSATSTSDVDVALDRVADAVEDWSGGTRIGACIAEFNHRWSRRVLGQGAIALFISDGLDRDAGEGLAEEMERLHKSCRRLIWLNPLLRYEKFEPRSLGMKAILPHVDDFRTVHNLESLTQLADALGNAGARREEGVSRWLGGEA